MIKFIRRGFLGLALAGIVLLLLIALNLTHFGKFEISRFRETSLAIYFCLAMFVLLRKDRATFIRQSFDQLQKVLGHRLFFPVMSAGMLALYLLAAFTRHLSFHTYSHDFSMLDEALYRSYHGQFMFSPVLGKSFFSEHFSPLLILFIPLHYLFQTPYLLVILQPLALWASSLILRRILTQQGTSRVVTNLACLIYLNNPVMISTLNYLFHMESFLPLLLFAMYYYYRSGRVWQYWVAMLLALMVKEDVGLYLLGFSAYLVLVEKKYSLGLGTALVSLLWVAWALKLVIPSYAGVAENYKFLNRWLYWGDSPEQILLGYARHPLEFIQALFSSAPVSLFLSLLFLPFWGRGTWLFFIIPWIINSTSAYPLQKGLSLYYGIPLFSLAVLAAVKAMTSSSFKALPSSRLGPLAASLAVVLNLAFFTFPFISRQRAEFLQELNRIPSGVKVQALSCFHPVLGYTRDKLVLWPEDKLTEEYVIILTESTTWPFTRRQVQELIRTALDSGAYVIQSRVESFYILHRTEGIENGSAYSEPSRKKSNET